LIVQLEIKTTFLTVALGLVYACTLPTEMCGCPPSRSSAAVIGTLKDALGAPLGNRNLVFEARPEGVSNTLLVFPTEVRTDSTGAFAVRVYSHFAPNIHAVTAIVVRAAEQDTVRIQAGAIFFKYDQQAPDTLRAALRLP